jgi:hypothetical protein
MSPSRRPPFEPAGPTLVAVVSVNRTGPDTVAWTFDHEVLDPVGAGDIRVNDQPPAEILQWTGALLIARYDNLTDPATWSAVYIDNEPYFGDGLQLTPAAGPLDRYT